MLRFMEHLTIVLNSPVSANIDPFVDVQDDQETDLQNISLRDVLSWIEYMNSAPTDAQRAFIDGGCMVLLDGIGMDRHGPDGLDGFGLKSFKRFCVRKMSALIGAPVNGDVGLLPGDVMQTPSHFAIGPFAIAVGPQSSEQVGFSFTAPTTHDNAMRVLRAMQLPKNKPILLEGSPGL
jgi:midasin